MKNRLSIFKTLEFYLSIAGIMAVGILEYDLTGLNSLPVLGAIIFCGIGRIYISYTASILSEINQFESDNFMRDSKNLLIAFCVYVFSVIWFPEWFPEYARPIYLLMLFALSIWTLVLIEGLFVKLRGERSRQTKGHIEDENDRIINELSNASMQVASLENEAKNAKEERKVLHARIASLESENDAHILQISLQEKEIERLQKMLDENARIHASSIANLSAKIDANYAVQKMQGSNAIFSAKNDSEKKVKRAYFTLQKVLGKEPSIKQVSDKVGMNRNTVSKYIKNIKMPPK